MDQRDLFLSCRRGDLERVRYLVEQKEVELNIRDQWDSTPLYYACLCGHYEVAKYLLEQGAKCEANTFDGERCLYGALNSEIKHLLLHEYKVISSHIIRRDLYHEFLRRLLERCEHADVCFEVHGQHYYVHKCIVAARSEYFYDQFITRWRDRTTVHITREEVNPVAFESMLQYMYTGRLEIHVDHITDLLRLVRHCKMHSLLERVEDHASKTHVFERMKPGTHVTTVVVETPSDNFELQADFGVLAEEAMPPDLCNWVGASELPFFPEERAPFADIIFDVEGHQFRCHKAFVCGRSEYFKTILRDPFNEQDPDTDGQGDKLTQPLPVVKLHSIKAGIFMILLYYIYQESAQLDVENVFDVLVAADICLLPGLKRQCGAFMAKYLDTSNVCNALRTARMFDLPRLEDQCYQCMAEHLEQMIEMEDFHQIVLEDASVVQDRHDVDSIDIVDNIRFHLTANSIDEAHDKLEMIDSLLERLNLNA